MFNIGPLEIAVIAMLALVVVGPKRLPEVGKMVAKSLRQFRDAQDEFKKSIDLNGLLGDDKPPTFDKPPSSRTAEGAAAAAADFSTGRGKARRGPGPTETPEEDEEALDGSDPAEPPPDVDERPGADRDPAADGADGATGDDVDTSASAVTDGSDHHEAGDASPAPKRKRTWDADDVAAEDDQK